MPIDTPFLRARFRPLRSVLTAAALLAFGGTAFAEPEFVKSVKPGPGLYEVVFSGPMNRVYVASAGTRNSTEAKILALDPVTLETRETIDLGAEAVFGLGINNRTRTLYGTQTRLGSVAAIDLTTGKVVATIARGEKAHVREAVVDEAANRIYVSVMGRKDDSSVWIIDGATNTLIESIDNLSGGVSGISLDAKGNRLFASALQGNAVLVIDLATRKVTQSFASGGEGSINLVYDADGDQLFVANQGTGDVVVLDARDGRVVKKIATGEGALSVNLDARRDIVYVTNRRAGFVTLIDTNTLEPIANIVTGSMPQTVALDPETGNAYVTNKTKTAGRPRPPAPPAGAAVAPGAGAPSASPVAAAPAPAGAPPASAAPASAAPAGAAPAGASAEGGPRSKPVPMVDPYGDTVTLIKP